MNNFSRQILSYKYCPILILGIVIIPFSILNNFEILTRISGNHISNQYHDLNQFISLAKDLRCSAFYPLWPFLIKNFSYITSINLHLSSITLSITFGLISLFYGINNIDKLSINKKLSKLLSYIYVLSPMTVFFFVGYTEAIFSLQSWILISLIIKFKNLNSFKLAHYLYLFFICILIGLTRSTILQTIFASFGSLILIKLKYNSLSKKDINFKRLIKICFFIIGGCLFGYTIIGIICSSSGEGFFAPFSYQSIGWDKSLGFRPSFLFNSRSPIIDLWGLYYPFLIFAVYLVDFSTFRIRFENISLSIYKNLPITLIYPPLGVLISILKKSDRKFICSKNLLVNQIKSDDIYFEENEFLFLYCILFAMSHSLICFFTQENYLYSLGRYVFGQPYFYVALSIFINSKKRILLNNPKITLALALFISVVYLIRNFIDFGNSKLLL